MEWTSPVLLCLRGFHEGRARHLRHGSHHHAAGNLHAFPDPCRLAPCAVAARPAAARPAVDAGLWAEACRPRAPQGDQLPPPPRRRYRSNATCASHPELPLPAGGHQHPPARPRTHHPPPRRPPPPPHVTPSSTPPYPPHPPPPH